MTTPLAAGERTVEPAKYVVPGHGRGGPREAADMRRISRAASTSSECSTPAGQSNTAEGGRTPNETCPKRQPAIVASIDRVFSQDSAVAFFL